MIAMPDTSLCPHAMMIKLKNAFSASTTVRNAWPFPIVTFVTSLFVIQAIGLDIFLLQFSNVTVDPHGLNVAPQAHEDVKKSKIAHQLSLEITN